MKGGFAQLRNDLWTNEKMRRIAQEHPKEFALWVISISFCSDKLTDGQISDYAISELLGVKKRQKERMFELGLWDETEDGACVHDYLESQNSREEIEQMKTSNAKRQAKHRAKQRKDNADSNALHNCTDNTQITDTNLKPKTKNQKEREKENPSPSDDDGHWPDVDAWHPSPSCYQRAVELRERGLPFVDVPDLEAEFRDAIKAKGIRHYGYRDLDAAFASWITKRAKSLRDERQAATPGLPATADAIPAKPHKHTWKCAHVRDLLRCEDGESPDVDLGCHLADLLNTGTSPDQALEQLGLPTRTDELKEIA